MTRIQGIAKRGGSGAVSGSHRQAGSVINQSSNLDQVEEDSWVNGLWSWGVVVAERKSLEDFRRKVQPWSMIRRDIAPVSVGLLVSRMRM